MEQGAGPVGLGPGREGLADDLLPVFDVSDEVAVVVAAGSSKAWDALMGADLIELGRQRRLAGLLGATRMLPGVVWDLMHGRRPVAAPEGLTLRDTTALPRSAGGWVLLGERAPEEIALGLVGRFWRPVIEYADVEASSFAQFDEPGFAKTIYALGTRPLGPDRTLLWALMRTATTDERARTWFRRYWTAGVGSGAHVLAHSLLDLAREHAERDEVRAPASSA